jgi:hypothetical protein
MKQSNVRRMVSGQPPPKFARDGGKGACLYETDGKMSAAA